MLDTNFATDLTTVNETTFKKNRVVINIAVVNETKNESKFIEKIKAKT